jgi:FAD:protein FMN transferase
MTAAPAPAPARFVHVEHCMGTVFTVDIRDPGHWDDAVADVVAWLHRVDAVFSCYRQDSDISRIQRRELRAADADPDVLTVLELCSRVQIETGGAFTAMPHGRLDPTGLVKGWAIERASDRLRAHGSANHAVNGGGDLQLAGGAAPDRPWKVGISDPRSRGGVLTTVCSRDGAVASSGTFERGAHIVDRVTGRPPTGLVAASIVGPSLTFADAYATAAFVMGPSAIEWIEGIAGYAALVVGSDGRVLTSRRWQALAA